MCVMWLRGCECDGGCEYDCGLWMWWVSGQCVCQTKHTAGQTRPENTPESDTCLKVKFNLIKISAQAKTLRGSVYFFCSRLVWRWSTARMPNEVNTHRRSQRRAGQEVAAQMDTQRWIGTGGGCRGSPHCIFMLCFLYVLLPLPGGIITLWSALALDEMSFVKRCTRS